MITENDVIPILKDLIQIKSENPPGNTLKIADYIKNLLEDNGIETELQNYAEDTLIITRVLPNDINASESVKKNLVKDTNDFIKRVSSLKEKDDVQSKPKPKSKPKVKA